MTSKVLPIDVAQYIIDIFKAEDVCLTTLKLQKLVYYSQAIHMTWTDDPIFDEDFHAWICGPMLLSLYNALKNYYYCPGEIPDANVSALNTMQRGAINFVIDVFGDKTSFDLTTFTNTELPWKEARGDLNYDEPSENIITKESMLRYYSTKMYKCSGD